MNCTISCGIFLIFLIGMLYKLLFTSKCKILKSFMDTLSNEQKEIYNEIINNRRSIYFKGYGLGLIIAIIYIVVNKKTLNIGKYTSLCLIGSIMFVTNYFFYILHPKGKFMLNYLTGKNQIDEWLQVYKKMQYDYHLGMLLGIIAVVFLGNAFCK